MPVTKLTGDKTESERSRSLNMDSSAPKILSPPTASIFGAQAHEISKNADLANLFKADLTSIRNLVTCSICDQLLFEPWTIMCGHTYCYSCLCSWFGQNKRKKSCPECRSKVKAMPAPSFLVKQLVEVIFKRSELTLADETVEQHQQKRSEEIAIVEKDRISSQGLFKGMFVVKKNGLWMDETDSVLRCFACGFEYEGGPVCSHCGEQINNNQSYDMDQGILESEEFGSLEFDLDADSDGRSMMSNDSNLFEHLHGYRNFITYSLRDLHPGQTVIGSNSTDDEIIEDTESEASELSASDSSSNSGTDEDDDGSSLQDFIAPDDEIENDNTQSYASEVAQDPDVQFTGHSQSFRRGETITISDSDSDEGGAISNRRQRQRRNISFAEDNPSLSPVASAMTVTDLSNAESDMGDHGSEAELLRYAGWSPLDYGNDSENDSQNFSRFENNHISGYGVDSDSETNTEKLVDDERFNDNNRSRQDESNSSETPTYRSPNYRSNSRTFGFSNVSDDDSDSIDSNRMDRDGDTNMNISPQMSQSNRSASSCVSGSHSMQEELDRETFPSIENQASARHRIFGHGSEHLTSDRSSSPPFDETFRREHTRRARQLPTHHAANVQSRRGSLYSANRTNRRHPASGHQIRTTHQPSSSEDHVSGARRTRDNSGRDAFHQTTTRGNINIRSGASDDNNFDSSIRGENIGAANEIHDLEEESDDSIQPPTRRHIRQSSSARYNQRYDPRISLMFAEHQETLINNRVSDLHVPDSGRTDVTLRPRRMAIYRNMSTRRDDVLRGSMIPTRSTVSSSHQIRPPRQNYTRI
ncbi:RING finger domain-containing protein [Blumeria hordei DH14]|uniref:RING finger domain-containing protein n=1 Tax=Blumeria graminis f. sp. hordei (strain DH14) TaxID=546991 RepID=N1JJ99_BLUG1|nr:RING finger domain-containing protein [Blumeria hordei DH14]